MTAISGRKCVGSWTNSGPLGCLEKMLLDSSRWASTRCFLTWKPSATPAGRLLFRLSPSMPRTEGTESGLLHTPTETANQLAPSMATREPGSWARDSRLLPTPTVTAATQGQNEPDGKRGQTLVSAARGQLWPTPSATDYKGSGQTGQTRDRLDYAAERGATKNKLYPSPDLGMAKGWGEASAAQRHRLGGSLNPAWVEWLMGFPLGWTDLNASETPLSRKSSNVSDGR